MITFGYKNKSNSGVRILGALALSVVFFVLCALGQSPFMILAYIFAAFLVAAGLVSVVYAFAKRRHERDFNLTLLGGCVEIVLGIVLVLAAKPIGSLLYYLVAAAVALYAIYHIIVYVSMRKVVKVNIVFYIIPGLAIIAAIVLCGVKDKGIAAGYVAGAALLIFAVSELIAFLKVRKAIRTSDETENVDVKENAVDVKAEKVGEASGDIDVQE